MENLNTAIRVAIKECEALEIGLYEALLLI